MYGSIQSSSHLLRDVEPQRLRPAGTQSLRPSLAIGIRSGKATRLTGTVGGGQKEQMEGGLGRHLGCERSRDTCIRVASRQTDQRLLVGSRTSRVNLSRGYSCLWLGHMQIDRGRLAAEAVLPVPKSSMDDIPSDGIPEFPCSNTYMALTGHVMKSRSTQSWLGLVKAWILGETEIGCSKEGGVFS